MSGGPGSTSPSLLARVRERDARAWDRLVELYAPFVYRCCRGARLPEADAADVFQEVFRQTAAHVGEFELRGEGGSFRGWLATLTRHEVANHYRRNAHEPRGVGGTQRLVAMGEFAGPPPAEEESAMVASAERALLRAALERVRGCVRESTWLAFVGTAMDGRPTQDVGEELGMTPGAVRVARSRVLQRLRTELGER